MDKGKNENRCDWGVLKDILGCVVFVVLAVVLIVLVVITCLEWAFDQFGFHFMFWKMVSMLLAFEVFTIPASLGGYKRYFKKPAKTDGAEKPKEKKKNKGEERCATIKEAFLKGLAKKYRNDPWMSKIMTDEKPETLLGLLTGEVIANLACAFVAFSVKTLMFVYLLKSFGCNYGFWHMFPVVVILSMFITDRICVLSIVSYILSLFGIGVEDNQSPQPENPKTADVTDITVVDNKFDEKTVEAVDNAVKGEKKTLAEFGPFEQGVGDDEKDS